MTKIKKTLYTGAIFFGIASCIGPRPKQAIRIGINSWPGYEFLYLASKLDLYKKHGAEAVEVLEFNSLSDARRAFERGQIDIIGTTVYEAVLARHNSDRNPRAFYVADYSDGADVILAKNGIASVKSLKGKTVALEIGSITVYNLVRALQLNHLNLSDVKVVNVSPETIMEEAKKDSISAVVTYPPFSLQIKKSLNMKEIFSSKSLPNEIVDILLASDEFISSHADQVRAVAYAFEEAKDYALKNLDGIQIMADREKVSVEEFKSTISDGVRLVSSSEQEKFLKAQLLQKVANDTEKILFDQKIVSGPSKVHGFVSDVALK